MDNEPKPENQRKEILALKEQLRSARQQREELFEKKRQLGKQITDLIDSVKKRRDQRNNLTKSVRDSKEKRRDLNKVIREKIAQLKELQKDRRHVAKDGSRIDPVKLSKEIERMNYRLETEGMSFDKEQKLMKTIREKQQLFEQVKGAADSFYAIKELSAQVDELKKQADQFHVTVQQDASESQRQHEEMIAVSKQIDDLKNQERQTHKQYLKARETYNGINAKLKDIIGKADKQDQQDDEFDEPEHKPINSASVKERLADINEKIKTSGKLTTEDLMLMQQAGDLADDD